MKNLLSFIVCIIICIVMLQCRVANSDMHSGKPPLKVTVWDAFGYYVYLPSMFIYHDCTRLQWLDSIDKRYAVTGGDGYQAQKVDNGNYVFKYLGGVAIMEIPLFFVGHLAAKMTHYPLDGFSPPYQYALGFGVLLYCFLAVLLLRKVLLRYFTDITVAVTLLMVCLATNFLQYAAVDNGQSHGYIFPLYVLVLYTTIRWHVRPSSVWALLTGYIIGLAIISRPTEAIMLFIPMLWNTQTKEAAKAKWQLVKQHKPHMMIAAAGGLAGILPQLIYWKWVTGSFIYDVGSKWEFLSPHFRVLFGWEKGWFIYTPITICFIIGMFFIRRFPFRKSVLWFCLLNIYIIIAWHDWRYGGSYSTRALVQSYPVFALPFAALVDRIRERKWPAIGMYVLGAYLLFANLFQINQYNTTVLHFNDMNRPYYGSIYLNPNPTPKDMSLLDNDEVPGDEARFTATTILETTEPCKVSFPANTADTIASVGIGQHASSPADSWLKIECTMRAPGCLWQGYLNGTLEWNGQLKSVRARLFNAISYDSTINHYSLYLHMPANAQNGTLKLYVTSPSKFEGVVDKIMISRLDR